MKTATIGTRVRMSGEFLRNTGQFAGGDGPNRWTVVACECGLCRTGQFCAVDQKSYDDPERQRHINVAHLEKCRS